MAIPTLTRGVLSRFIESSDSTPLEGSPVLQVLGVREMTRGVEPKRFRIIVSDGVTQMTCLLSPHLCPNVENGSLCESAIILVDSHKHNKLLERKILTIVSYKLLVQQAEKIGHPVTLEPAQYPKPSEEPLAGAGNMYSNDRQSNRVGQFQKPQAMVQNQNFSEQNPQYQSNNFQNQQNNSFQQQAQNQNVMGQQNNQRGGSGQQRLNQPSSSNATPLINIAAITPYGGKSSVRGRVQNKGEIKNWSNQRGEGKLISFVIGDKTGDIRVTAFNATADRVNVLVTDGRVYEITGFRAKMAQRAFNNSRSDYELSLDEDCEIVECSESSDDVPIIDLSGRISLAELGKIEANETVDFIAVVHEIGAVTNVVVRSTQREVGRRDLVVVDESEYAVKLTLWGRQAESVGFSVGTVIACRGARVGDFGGRTLSLLQSSVLSISPDVPEAHALLGWYERGGKQSSYRSHASGALGGGAAGEAFGVGGELANEITSLAMVQDGSFAMQTPEYYTCEAFVTFVRDTNMFYTGCPTCNKKVNMQGNAWYCEKCSAEVSEPNYRYVVSLCVADASGQMWLNLFNEQGAAIFGHPASVLANSNDGYGMTPKALALSCLFKYFRFRVRAKADMYNDEARVRHNVLDVCGIDSTPAFVAAGHRALNQIASFK